MPSQWNSPPHPPPGGYTKSGKPTSVFTQQVTPEEFIMGGRAPQEVDTNEVTKSLGPTRRFQVNQGLEKRAGLRFNYAGLEEAGITRTRWLPFYENPNIIESRRANYAKAEVFLRNEPVRLYTGSDARKFKVDVSYSIYHMAMMCPTAKIFSLFQQQGDTEFISEWQTIKSYVQDIAARDTGSWTQTLGNPQFDLNQAIEDFHDRAADGSDGPFGPIPGRAESQFNAYLIYLLSVTNGYTQIFGLLQYMLNNIRGSVIGTSTSPVKGPPIVELKWGLMYDFVPCIITDYKLQPIEEAGYDPKSLFAQRLKVSLSMEEMRNVHGNLWGNPSITGQLPGWDNVLSLNQSGQWWLNTAAGFDSGYRSFGEDVSNRNRLVGPPPTFQNHLSQN